MGDTPRRLRRTRPHFIPVSRQSTATDGMVPPDTEGDLNDDRDQPPHAQATEVLTGDSEGQDDSRIFADDSLNLLIQLVVDNSRYIHRAVVRFRNGNPNCINYIRT